MDLFHERGYVATGVKDICERAGVSRGSFYHFFPSKRALALASIDRHAEEYRALLEEAMREELPGVQRIRRLFELIYDRHRGTKAETGHVRGCAIGNLALEMRTQDEVLRDRLREVFEEWVPYFEAAVRAAAAEESAMDTDPTLTAWAILAYLEGAALLAATWSDPELFAALSERAVLLATGGPGRPTAGELTTV